MPLYKMGIFSETVDSSFSGCCCWWHSYSSQ